MFFFDENFWIAVSFIIFLYFSYNPVKKVIINYLDKKINEIKEKLAQTEKIKAEANLLLEEVQKELKNFDKYRDKMIKNVKSNTKKFINRKMRDIEILLAQKGTNAAKLIENEKSKVVEQLKVELIDTTISIVQEYIAKSEDIAISNKAIIEEFINSN